MSSPLQILTTLFKSRIKNKKVHRALRFDQLKWLKSYVEFYTQKVGKALCKFMNKTMENMKSRADVRLVNSKKDYLKWTSKPGFETQNIFDNDSGANHKIKA